MLEQLLSATLSKKRTTLTSNHITTHIIIAFYRVIALTRNLSSAYQTLRRKYGMQYFNSFGNGLLFRYIHKGRLVKLSGNIAFLFLQRNLHEIFDTIL